MYAGDSNECVDGWLWNVMPKTQCALTEKQKLHHARFAAIAKLVKQMMAEGSKKSRKQLWKIATKAYDEKNQ